MDFKVDLNKLKQEIDSRKTEQTTKDVALGRVSEGAIPRKKSFLNDLVTSMHRGVKTEALETIKAVNETVESRHGGVNAVDGQTQRRRMPQPRQQYVETNEEIPQRRNASDEWSVPGITGTGGGRRNTGGGYQQPNYEGGGGYGEREDLFEQTIAQRMAEYDRMKMSGHPIASKAMENVQHNQQRYINEQVIVETPYENDRNIEKIVESSFKNVITQVYTKERIQESLIELLQTDEGLKIVGRAINEIAKRNKAKLAK